MEYQFLLLDEELDRIFQRTQFVEIVLNIFYHTVEDYAISTKGWVIVHPGLPLLEGLTVASALVDLLLVVVPETTKVIWWRSRDEASVVVVARVHVRLRQLNH